MAPLITIAENQLNVYSHSRDFHAETAPKLEAKKSKLAKQSRESEQWLKEKAAELEKQLLEVKQKLNDKTSNP